MNAEERERIVHEVAAKHMVPGDYAHALRELAVRVERETLLEVLEKNKTVAAASTVRDRLRRMAAAVK